MGSTIPNPCSGPDPDRGPGQPGEPGSTGSAAERLALLDELARRYDSGRRGPNLVLERFRRWRKKFVWALLIHGLKVIKRLVDLFVASITLIMLTPLFLLLAILIKLSDGGPVFFWQKRVGRWGREFAFPKFRTMVVDAEKRKDSLLSFNDHVDGVTFKMKRDPRVTWIGRSIRRMSLDELPQLWCVLTGDMSLVGPRPPLPREVAAYRLADRRRLDVVPGLTCIWQVSGRGDIPFERQVELDVEYIRSRSLWLDVKLLLRTIPAVLGGRGAY
jgi:lipopolysaccharide/colanic/teichoic acid biosynthesis glycosyltransferase